MQSACAETERQHAVTGGRKPGFYSFFRRCVARPDHGNTDVAAACATRLVPAARFANEHADTFVRLAPDGQVRGLAQRPECGAAIVEGLDERAWLTGAGRKRCLLGFLLQHSEALAEPLRVAPLEVREPAQEFAGRCRCTAPYRQDFQVWQERDGGRDARLAPVEDAAARQGDGEIGTAATTLPGSVRIPE